MKFDAINLAACIVPEGFALDPRCADADFAAANPNLCVGDIRCADPAFAASHPSICNVQPPDQRCLDAEFAASNPSICSNTPYLIIKPAVSLVCSLGSIQFRVFLYQNGVETEVSDSLTFSSSDQSILAIGVHTGSATGLAEGIAIVTVSRLGITAKSSVTIISGCGVDGQGCDAISIKTSLLIDNSKSMGLTFGAGYSSRLAFAKACASGYADAILTAGGEPKDSIKVWSFGDVPDQVSSDFITDTVEIASEINSVTQTQTKTDLGAALIAAIDDMIAAEADEKVIVIFSDGEQTLNTLIQPILNAANLFKETGGIIICVGMRGSGIGYDLLSRIATGGFFLNAYPNNAAQILKGLNYLKSMLCAGECIVAPGTVNTPQLDYSDFIKWDVIAGQVNLIGAGLLDLQPGNGLYVDMMGGTAGTIRTVDSFSLVAGRDYKISFRAAGNNRLNTPSAAQALLVSIRNASEFTPALLSTIFQHSISPLWDDQFNTYSFTFTAAYDVDVKIQFQQLYDFTFTGEWHGNLIDDVKFEEVTTLTTLFEDDFNSENPIYTAPSCWNTPNPTFPVVVTGAADGNGVYHYVSGIYTSDDDPLFTISADEFGLWHIRLGGSDCYISLTQDMFAGWSVGGGECGAPAPTSVRPLGITEGNTGYNCEDCDVEASSLQSQDPNPLPDVETGLPSTTTYSSTKTACANCIAGSINIPNDALTPDETTESEDFGLTIPSWKQFTYLTPVLVNSFLVAIFDRLNDAQYPVTTSFNLQASNNGVDWDTLASFADVYWAGGSTPQLMYPILQPDLYTQYKITITSVTRFAPNATTWLNNFILYGVAEQQICKQGSAISYVSQIDADNKASAAALALAQAELNCVQKFTSTQSYKAECSSENIGSLGSSVTKTATAISYNSQSEADDLATEAAKALALAELDCTASNNGQKITIGDNVPASPFPSVQYVSGKTGLVTAVTVTLKGFTHVSPEDVMILLRAPSGEYAVIMANCGGTNSVSGLNIVIDDAAGSDLPDSTALSSGTFKPKKYGVFPNFTPPAPQESYSTIPATLATFVGVDPNGSWSLWVEDINAPDSGQIASGWEITITSA